jgi:replication initiation protein RepC
MERLATTPFGGAKMSARLFLRQAETAERQQKLANGEGGNQTGRVDKWLLLRALTEARERYGLGDRTIAVLEALVSFTGERELDGAKPVIVFPSNRELSMRARGMAPATLRRHIAALVEAGLLFRRDSPNGKRFCRRDDHGSVEDAFGFDLAPLALRADEILAFAEEVRAEEKALKLLRSEVTLHQRDIAKIIDIAIEEGRAGDWADHLQRLATLGRRIGRRTAFAIVTAARDELAILRRQVETDYLNSLEEQEMSANDHQSERHHQNSKTDQAFESHGQGKNKSETLHGQGHRAEDISGSAPERKAAISLARLMRICPDIASYAKGGISGWTDLIRTADLVRSMLGISPDAWRRAVAAMGQEAAAVVIAAMLERAEDIKSPGGYLRNLTTRAENGSFSIFPMLQALERRR